MESWLFHILLICLIKLLIVYQTCVIKLDFSHNQWKAEIKIAFEVLQEFLTSNKMIIKIDFISFRSWSLVSQEIGDAKVLKAANIYYPIHEGLSHPSQRRLFFQFVTSLTIYFAITFYKDEVFLCTKFFFFFSIFYQVRKTLYLKTSCLSHFLKSLN